jgi:hypothetical protein
MPKLILSLLLSILLYCIGQSLNAQKIKVEIKSVEDIENKLVVKYELLKSKSSQKFRVSVELNYSNGNRIPIKSLSGDIGENISGGSFKQLIWDYNNDGIILQDEITIEVSANLTGEEVGLSRVLLLSTIVPGMGLNRIEKKKSYWLLGIAGYGCLGTSWLMNKKANDSYDLYLANTLDNQNDKLLSKSQDQNKLSKTMAYTALGFWGINLVWTAIKAKNGKQKTIAMNHHQKLLFYTAYHPLCKTPVLCLKYHF